MENNINNINPNMLKKTNNTNPQDKLTEYRKRMDKSDFSNTFSRYSMELSIIKDEISKAQKNGLNNRVEELNKELDFVYAKLEELGFKYNR